MVYTQADFHELGLEETPWQEHLLYRSGMFMGPADHPDRKLHQKAAPAIRFIIDEVTPKLIEAWDRLSEQIQKISEVLENNRGKPPKTGPRRELRPPRVIMPAAYRSHPPRRPSRHGRRPREHQFRRHNSRAPPNH